MLPALSCVLIMLNPYSYIWILPNPIVHEIHQCFLVKSHFFPLFPRISVNPRTPRNRDPRDPRPRGATCRCFRISPPLPYLAKDHRSLAAESALQSLLFRRPENAAVISMKPCWEGPHISKTTIILYYVYTSTPLYIRIYHIILYIYTYNIIIYICIIL